MVKEIGQDTNSGDRAEDEHDKMMRIHGVYTSFIAAAAVAVIASRGYKGGAEAWAFVLWIFSLPCLASYMLLDFIVRVSQRRRLSATRGVMLALGYSLSNIGIGVALMPFSWIASVAYMLWFLVCIALVRHVIDHGRRPGCEII